MQAMSKNKRPPSLNFSGFDSWVHIFSAGTHTDSSGATATFSQADLDQMVANHEPVPNVLGHPEQDAPAYAWTEKLKRVGDHLYMKVKDLNPHFAKAVENKAFPNRSVSIKYSESGWKLRHVGWLGAVPPALKNLQALAFAQEGAVPTHTFNDADHELREFEFSACETGSALQTLGRMMRSIREYFIAREGIEAADKIIQDYELNWVAENAASIKSESQKDNPLFNEPQEPTMAEYTHAQIEQIKKDAAAAALAARQNQFSEENQQLKQQLADRDKTARQLSFSAKADELIGKGLLLPKDKAGFVAYCMATDSDAEFTFSEGEGDAAKTVKKTPAQWLTEFCESRPAIKLGESDAGKAAEGGVNALAKKAAAYAEENACSIAEAMSFVQSD